MIERRLATVKPLLCFTKSDCREADKITLVRLSRQKRKGVMKRWAGDTAFEYSYKELSKEVVDIKNLPEHKIALEPGFYRFEYNDVHGEPPVGFFGKSDVFKVTSGKDMEVLIWVDPAL